MLAATLLCLVVGIQDGDTLTARCGQEGDYQQHRIRIHAIDAPERKQPFGDRSRRSLSALCFQQTAAIEQVDVDRYGRTVARVKCRGQDVAAHQVGAGMAWVYVQYAKDRPDLFLLETKAKGTRIGLWSDAQQIAPWDYRRSAR